MSEEARVSDSYSDEETKNECLFSNSGKSLSIVLLIYINTFA
jgi:hypothetical protein